MRIFNVPANANQIDNEELISPDSESTKINMAFDQVFVFNRILIDIENSSY